LPPFLFEERGGGEEGRVGRWACVTGGKESGPYLFAEEGWGKKKKTEVVTEFEARRKKKKGGRASLPFCFFSNEERGKRRADGPAEKRGRPCFYYQWGGETAPKFLTRRGYCPGGKLLQLEKGGDLFFPSRKGDFQRNTVCSFFHQKHGSVRREAEPLTERKKER